MELINCTSKELLIVLENRFQKMSEHISEIDEEEIYEEYRKEFYLILKELKSRF